MPAARERGYGPGRFSFNVAGGRCEACQGDGVLKVEMHFLPDVYVPCDVCHGKRYNRETLEITYKGFNINDVLEMTVEDALKLFEPVPTLSRKLETLVGVTVDATELESSAVDYERQVSRAVEMDPDVQAFVERLERAADEEEATPDPGELPSGDLLAREFQRFLRQRGADQP